MERICPRCQKTFSDDSALCPEDGAKLLVVCGDDDESRIGQVIDGKLTILGTLGRGGMGGVYRALQHSMEREVAVKVLLPSYSRDTAGVRRFLQEARAASHLSHPNIITLFDFGQTEQRELYLVMELLKGRPLSSLLSSGAGLTPQRAVALIAQVCDALDHAHDHGVIHRDLKPDNIFVIPVKGHGLFDEFVKVLDFGIAKMKSVPGAESITQSGVVCGTPAYMSPEQARGLEVDRRSDVYAIGIVLYELLAGAPPFGGDTPLEIMMAHLTDAPEPLRTRRVGLNVPPALDDVLRRALAKSPDARPATAAELKRLLQAALGPVSDTIASGPPASWDELAPVGASTQPATGRVSADRRSQAARGARWGLGAVALLATGIAVPYLIRRGPTTPAADLPAPPATRSAADTWSRASFEPLAVPRRAADDAEPPAAARRPPEVAALALPPLPPLPPPQASAVASPHRPPPAKPPHKPPSAGPKPTIFE